MTTLTAANSVLTIQVAGLYPVPQVIQGYATDDAFMADDVTTGEVQMGVDGRFSAGYVPYATPLNVTLQADSPSMAVFDNILSAQAAQREMFVINATILLPGTEQKYAMTRGFMITASPMPGVKKILQPRKFTIHFESCTPAPN